MLKYVCSDSYGLKTIASLQTRYKFGGVPVKLHRGTSILLFSALVCAFLLPLEVTLTFPSDSTFFRDCGEFSIYVES